AYSYVTATVENGQFAGLDYEWSKWPRDKQVEYARQLFAEAGYGPGNPLEITISYNTNEGHKKIALAIGSMWEDVFGKDSIVVKQANQEWKTFLRDRSEANYDVARDGWEADYDSVDSYTVLYTSGGPQNNSKTDTPGYNELLDQAKRATDPAERVRLIRQAVTLAMSDYGIIPLYQYTYSRLISSRVKGYDPKDNHLDHVMSKWYKF
ncbi:MAG: ABC transporter substrate-binding protein, partial [Negativicutes bacterium]|nr:ABC transporter substrate-binding protein [Negativicutes bacterium]